MQPVPLKKGVRAGQDTTGSFEELIDADRDNTVALPISTTFFDFVSTWTLETNWGV